MIETNRKKRAATMPMPSITKPIYALCAAIGTLLMLSRAPAATLPVASPPPLTRIAKSLAGGDELQRFDFADALLEVLQESYREELAASTRERASTEDRRRKLARWRGATADMLERFASARLQLGEGAEARVHVDSQGQVLLFIGDQAVAFSAPRPDVEHDLEQRAVTRYCAYSDCTAIADSGDVATVAGPPPGEWRLFGHRRPAYQVGEYLRCSFDDLVGRAAKQLACEDAADETARLIDALRRTSSASDPIDWQRISTQRSVVSTDVTLRSSADGRTLRLVLPRLARLDRDAWQAFVGHVAALFEQRRTPVLIERGDQLIDRRR